MLRDVGEPGRLSPPIWPCTTRGFPCLRDCSRSGGLLPHLFTLTCDPCKPDIFGREKVSLPVCHRGDLHFTPAVYSLWHFP